MDKDTWKLGANCTDVDCKKVIPNSDCFAGLCKCRAGYGPSSDQRKCRKSKKFGQSCHPISDTCYMEKLYCDLGTMICQCGPGYRYDSGKNDCTWFYYCDDNLIWDTARRTCIKPSDYWFPSTNHNPKLSFITFILLVFCFIKVMRSNSPYNERRRRISANMNRNSFDLLSTIMNYETNQRYTMRSSDTNRHNLRSHLRRTDEESQEVFYDENQAPPAYEDIVSDLKAVTVINNNNNSTIANNTTYLNDQEDIELKEMNQGKLDQNSQLNLNNQYASTNHIESQSTSSESSLENTSGHGSNQEAVNNLVNRDQQPMVNHLGNNTSSNESARQSDDSQYNNHQLNQQPNAQPNDQANDQLNSSSSEDQLPTYHEAISKMPY